MKPEHLLKKHKCTCGLTIYYSFEKDCPRCSTNIEKDKEKQQIFK